MKLHDLHPAPGARTARTRVGRGISAGKGKTAGRGTKGQLSRSGGNLPAWFEGGQTPIHMRVPKLRGFKRRGRVEYEVVNVGDIERAAEGGRLETIAQEDTAGEGAPKRRGRSAGDAALTVNAEILQGAGLVRDLRRPLKVLGDGDLTRKLFVVADAFTKSAREKIEAVGGTAMTLETPSQPPSAVGVGEAASEEASSPPGARPDRPEPAGAVEEGAVEPTGAEAPAGGRSEAPVATSGESPAEPEAASRTRRRPRDRGSEASDRRAAGEPARDAQAGSEDS